MLAKNKRLLVILSVIPMLLLIPLIAMQFTTEVNWNTTDFAIAGSLLLCVGIGIELLIRNVKAPNKRIVFIVGAIVLLILIWMELAVGIFGTPLAGS